MILPIPKKNAISSCELKIIDQTQSHDRYGRDKIIDDYVVNNVVINMGTTYTGTNNNRELIANGLIIIYANWSNPIHKLTKDNLGSKAVIDGKEYTVTNIQQYNQPYSDDLYSYELELI